MGNICELFLERERQTLSPYAFLTANTRGRDHPYVPCNMRTEFQRDRDRIIHCQSFRRLMNKTQVFLAPAGDHYRTRLTHTLEVTQIARIIARALRLNEDLTEAAALGHDLGHTPFGHAGEEEMQRLFSPEFTHYRQSLRVVELLERDGAGLNLTWEVRDGIVNHTGSHMASTLEGRPSRFTVTPVREKGSAPRQSPAATSGPSMDPLTRATRSSSPAALRAYPSWLR